MRAQSTAARRVTLKMIADAAGLSVAAVSQILNNKANDFCSPATKDRVRETAKKMGYRPNLGVKLMRGEQVKSVAVMLAMGQMAQDEHIQYIVLQLFKAYERLGFSCYFCSDEQILEQNRQRIRNLLDYGVQRFIFMGKPLGWEELAREIHNAGRTLLYYETRPPAENDWGIHSDTASATAKILQAFPHLDLDRLAFFQLGLEPDDERFKGLQHVFPACSADELMARCVRLLPVDVRNTTDFFSECYRAGMQATRELLREKPHTEAIFLYSDTFALGAVPVLLEHYCRTGKLITLGGFNYIQAVRTSVYPIISAAHDCQAIVNGMMEEFSAERPVITVEPIVRKNESNFLPAILSAKELAETETATACR